MTDTIESVLKEIFAGPVKPPKPGDSTYPMVASLAQALIATRIDTSMAPYLRLYEINSLWVEIYNTVARATFERKTPRAMRKFYPGSYSEDGFLGWGESLGNIIADDKATLRRLRNIPKEADKEPHMVLGARLKQVMDDPASVQGITLTTTVFRGGQECPFDECRRAIYPHSNTEFTITRGRNGLVGPGMMWHLIEAHGFFEGAYSVHRVDPERLADILFG